MNQILTQQKIEILDRKYEFLTNTSPKTFAFDLVNFVKFLNEDEVIKDFTEKLHCEFKNNIEPYLLKSRERTKEFNTLLNNSNLALEEKSKCEKFFDANHRIVENALNSRNLKDRFEDNLQTNFSERLVINSEIREITNNLNNFVLREMFEADLFGQLWLTSPGRALDDLELLSFYIHSEFKPKNFDWRYENDLENSISDRINKEYLPNLFIPEQSENIVRLIKEKVKRVYETIRQEIGSMRLRLTVLDRYKVRSQSYNKDYLRNLSKEMKRKSEELLSKDLALYLFDQGFPVWYRVKRGQHEYDFLHPDLHNPLLVEVKVCKKSDRKYILQGLKQIHSYLSSCESEFQISEGYYIIFRLGGAIYEIPRKITTNRFIIYPIIIDLGESLDSGSKQVKPIEISLEDIKRELG